MNNKKHKDVSPIVEDVHGYKPGGYHPVTLGDEFSRGRYKVVRKLGHGDFSTVWLCRDRT
jgi:serine/threonine-protein kinase SRPK3